MVRPAVMKSLLLAVLVLLAVTRPAAAQLPAAIAKATVSAPAPAPPPPILTPAQAQAVLDVLQSDQKRTQFIAVLQNMAKVQAAAAPRAAGIPLTPGSLGAELLAGASGALQHGSRQLLITARTLTNFPLLWRWMNTTARDPDSRARLIDAGWKLAVVVLAGGLVEWLAWRALTRPREAVDQAAPHEETPAPTPTPGAPTPVAPTPVAMDATGPGADTAHAQRPPAKPSSWSLLRRIPYVLLRLLLGLAPPAAFAIVAYGLLATPLGEANDTRLVVLGLVDAYIAVRLAMGLVRMILAPDRTSLRLVHLSDASAVYLANWARRFLVVAIFGYAIDQTALLFGMYDAGHQALQKFGALVLHIFALIVVVECRGKVARHLRARPGAYGAWAMLCNRLAEFWHIIAIFWIVAFWLVFALEVHDGYAIIWRYFLILAATLAIGRLASIVLLGALDRSLRLRPETVARYPGLDTRADRYHPALRLLINTTIVGLCLFVLLRLWGVPIDTWLRHGTLGARVLRAILTSALVILLAFAAWEAANAAIQGHLARLARDAQLARSARLRTLLPMLRTTLLVIIFVFAALMVLSQIGVNTAPLLAGAGVIGIAIGFGSQKLVQDVITGLFLLLENAMQVGDWVSLASLSGTVENLSIRTIRLRALDGSVHVIPFSAVTTVTNMTRDYGYAVLDITAGYNEEPDRIADILRDVARELRADPRWAEAVQDDIDIQGVDRFLDNAWVLRARVKTIPSQRLPVQREFNRRLKYRFDQLAIESPFTSSRILSTNPPPPPDPEPIKPAEPAK